MPIGVKRSDITGRKRDALVSEQDMSPPTEPAHSGFGIASFVVSIAASLLSIVLIVIAAILEVTTPGGMNEESVAAILVGLSMLGLFTAGIVALGLGIGGLFQKNRKKIFTVLGIVFSCAFVAMIGALFVIGMIFG